MSDYQPGEIVDILIKGVRVAPLAPVRDDDRDNPVIIIDERGNLYALPPQAAITRVAPAEWPPQVDDLWRDAGGLVWFACAEGARGHVRLHLSNGVNKSPDVLMAGHGPMTLVHREETTPEPFDSTYGGQPT